MDADKETKVLSLIMPIFEEHYKFWAESDKEKLLDQIYAVKRILKYIWSRYQEEAEKKLRLVESEMREVKESIVTIEALQQKVKDLEENKT